VPDNIDESAVVAIEANGKVIRKVIYKELEMVEP
jgi:hypothetical protein